MDFVHFHIHLPLLFLLYSIYLKKSSFSLNLCLQKYIKRSYLYTANLYKSLVCRCEVRSNLSFNFIEYYIDFLQNAFQSYNILHYFYILYKFFCVTKRTPRGSFCDLYYFFITNYSSKSSFGSNIIMLTASSLSSSISVASTSTKSPSSSISTK